MVSVSTAAIFIRYAQAEGAPALVIAAYRLAIASLLVWPVIGWRRRAELRALTRRQCGLAAAAGVLLGLHLALWISSLAYTSVASSVVLVNTAPLLVAGLAGLWLHEKITRQLWAGILLALAGIVVIGLVDFYAPQNSLAPVALWRRETLWGNGLALAGAAAVAGYYTLGRAVRPSLSLLVYIGFTYTAAAGMLLALVLLNRLPLTGYSPRAYGWFICLAIVPQLWGHSAFNWALKYLPATFVSLTALGEPIGSTVLAIWLLNEIPAPAKILGGVLILAGILLAARTQPAPPANT